MPTRRVIGRTLPTHDERRPSAARRLYGRAWRNERLAYLSEHPLCVRCLANGMTVEATDVDHVIPHRGNLTLFWDRSNWASLCHACHSTKTRRGQ